MQPSRALMLHQAVQKWIEHRGLTSDDGGSLSQAKQIRQGERLVQLSRVLSGPSGEDPGVIRRVALELRRLAEVGLDQKHLSVNVLKAFRQFSVERDESYLVGIIKH